jgi:uncharacterized protein involved in tolerance to divalent cations
VPSNHIQFSVDFTTNIAESNFRYTQVMIIKTRATLAEQVTAAVKELHSYTTPTVMILPVESLDPAYHRWLVKETGA